MVRKIIVGIGVTVVVLVLYTAVGHAADRVYTEDDTELIARVVYAEARGESFEGKVAVAEVVMARYESGEFGDSLTRITRRSQFCKASAKTVSKPKNAAVYAECLAAVQYAIDNEVLPDNAYYFQRANRAHWRGRPSIIRYTTIGDHTFYTAGEAVTNDEEEARG